MAAAAAAVVMATPARATLAPTPALIYLPVPRLCMVAARSTRSTSTDGIAAAGAIATVAAGVWTGAVGRIAGAAAIAARGAPLTDLRLALRDIADGACRE